MEIAKTNSIVSDFSGTIESVNIADGATGSSGNTDSGSAVSNVSDAYDSEGLTVALLSDTEAPFLQWKSQTCPDWLLRCPLRGKGLRRRLRSSRSTRESQHGIRLIQNLKGRRLIRRRLC